jgi:hypothetical protein
LMFRFLTLSYVIASAMPQGDIFQNSLYIAVFITVYNCYSAQQGFIGREECIIILYATEEGSVRINRRDHIQVPVIKSFIR